MIIKHYEDVSSAFIDNDVAKGVHGRVMIGKNDGAANFCMRVFEIDPGGHTPKHSHEWEHEIFIHKGSGAFLNNGRWADVRPGTAVFIPGNEEHQIKNKGNDTLVVICLIPKGVPEL
ncbi:MAG: cupin domain-containing protein [Proteobacteria bacterium]|nr:cupin domain-containing protein [Pseudomonadota bacterium]